MAKPEIQAHVYKTKMLKQFVQRVLDVEEEKAADVAGHNDQIKSIFEEAGEAGFHPKILRRVIAEKKRVSRETDMPAGERACLNNYRADLGLEGTPLDAAAKKREAKDDEETAPEASMQDQAAVGAVGRGNRRRTTLSNIN
jgi:uncharacterized protein (UPF0335 family)